MFISLMTTLGLTTFISCSDSLSIYEEDPFYKENNIKDSTLTNDSTVIDATDIMRNATVVTSDEYVYAFGITQLVIIGNYAYIKYDGNKNKKDGDIVEHNNESCCSKVNLSNLSVEALNPIVASMKHSDGSDATAGTIIRVETQTSTPDGKISAFALMRFHNNNPCYCYAFINPDEQIYNYVTCKLEYTDKDNHHHITDYTLNNYRQMLVDMGYVDKYIASTQDYCDNINIHYDSENQMYYAVVATNPVNAAVSPLVLVQSKDMSTWSPRVNLGRINGANEITSIIRDDVLYVCYRTFKNGMRWLVYDLKNDTTLSEGCFNECKKVLSKPDTFTFGQDVYMAVNVLPSVYGDLNNYDHFTVRQEINIYKIVDGSPVSFRKIYNPDGINYFSFCESLEGKLYMAFSEDRRHLFRRQFSNISFANLTDLFVDN